MDESVKKVEVTAFDAARLRAIENYSVLETRLAWILGLVLGIDMGKAHIIFYRIVNARSRMGIIKDLLEKSSYAETKPYWRSVEKEVLRIDGLRNRIIHYLGVYDHGTVGGPEPTPATKTLAPGVNFSSGERLALDDLESFIADTQSLAIELLYYGRFLRGDETPPDERDSLRKIFQRPRDDQTRPALETVLFPTAQKHPLQS